MLDSDLQLTARLVVIEYLLSKTIPQMMRGHTVKEMKQFLEGLDRELRETLSSQPVEIQNYAQSTLKPILIKALGEFLNVTPPDQEQTDSLRHQ